MRPPSETCLYCFPHRLSLSLFLKSRHFFICPPTSPTRPFMCRTERLKALVVIPVLLSLTLEWGGGIFLLWVSAWIYLKHSCLHVNKVAVGTVHVAFVVVYAQWLDGNVVSWLWPASGCHRGGRVSDDVCKVLQPRG